MENLKQELENKIKKLENNIEELKKAIVAMDNNDKKWIPKTKEEYYYIDNIGCYSIINCDTRHDKDIINNGNYFKTKEQARRVLFEQNLRLKLRKFVENNNEKNDWNNDSMKYYLIYNYNTKKILIGKYIYSRDFSQIYFSSEEIARKAIDEFRDELIEYFTKQSY